MTPEDQARYGRLRTMCEFMTNVASAMQFSGGLSDVLRGRIEESIKPVREAREWIWDIGQLMALAGPPPAGFYEALEITESRALHALPVFKAAMDEACSVFVGGSPEATAAGMPKAIGLRTN